MKYNRLFNGLLIAGLLFIGLSSSELLADEKKGWKILGQRTVKEGLSREQIMVKAKKGKFSQLKVQVKNAPAQMEKMILHFNKDEKQVVWFKRNFKEGSWSRVIRVKGGKRVIQRVVFWYSKNGSGDENPVVFLWGRQK